MRQMQPNWITDFKKKIAPGSLGAHILRSAGRTTESGWYAVGLSFQTIFFV
jgi:hypothetical protein